MPLTAAPVVMLVAPVEARPLADVVQIAQLKQDAVGAQDNLPVIVVSPRPDMALAEAADQAPAVSVPQAEDLADESGTTDGEIDAIEANRDPLEGFNRAMFGIHQAMDKVILRPAAMGYKQVVPKPVRSGLRNLLSNLTEPFIFLNFLLQAKPGKAAETFARFAVNSTLGVGGLIDVAKQKDFNLPHRPNGLGTTLAIYGVKSGPYLFLPFIGPTTLRDVLGKPADEALLPLAVGRPFSAWEYQLTTGVIGGLDMRAEADPELRALFGDAIDPYATLRSVYLQNRAAEIEETRGRHTVGKSSDLPELDDSLNDPASSPAPSDAPELKDPLSDPAGN